MELGTFEEKTDDAQISRMCREILGTDTTGSIFRICERYGSNPEEVRKYDVYRIETALGSRMLKKAAAHERTNYETLLAGKPLPVPRYFGSCTDGDSTWILLEYIAGTDLRDMTDSLAIEAANSLAAIQNGCWGQEGTERYAAYLERIAKRYAFIKAEPLVGEAYRLFLNRQKNCPLTLSNADFLQLNAVNHQGRVYLIDWGFGGILPYSLDIARFIAHGTENRDTFPIYMNDRQKGLFVRQVYSQLTCKPDYPRYLLDIKLAVLNEYVEFVEAAEDDDGWYLTHARALAAEILAAANNE